MKPKPPQGEEGEMMKTLEIKIYTPKPPEELLNALQLARLNHSDPETLFHCLWLGDTRYCGVFGDGDGDAYEWFTWDGEKLEHSDCGYGDVPVALRDVLEKVVI